MTLPKVRYVPAFTLSEVGSDRGTAYPFANKSVTIGGKTFVTWTDAIAITQARVFTHADKSWGPTVTLGPGVDNHNSPSLTVNMDGHLRVAYGPHGAWGHYPVDFCAGAFKVGLASAPASLDNMDKTSSPVGYFGTYACLEVTASNRDCFVYRGGESAHRVIFQIHDQRLGWSMAKELVHQDLSPQYTHYGAQVVTTRDGKIYVIAHTYGGQRETSLGVVLLRSSDEGKTWTNVAGCPVTTPTYFDPAIAVPAPPETNDPRSGGLVVDTSGGLHALTYGRSLTPGLAHPLLSHWNGSAWRTINLAPQLPAGANVYDGNITIDSADRLHIVLTASFGDPEKTWGSAGSEIFHLVSNDKQNFVCNRVSDGHATLPNWHGTITLPSLHNPIDKPVILYTQGPDPLRPPTNEGCAATVKTRIVAVMVDGVE